jgi:hypothetical protein
MYCVIQELQLRKFNPYGAYKQLVVDTNPFNWGIHPQYGYQKTGDRYERPIRTAYKISVHENKRIGGMVTKKQFVVTTTDYYTFATGWFALEEYNDKISDIAEKLQVDIGIIYHTIEAKTIPLEERIKAEFALTDEYRIVLEQNKIIDAYKEEKAAFARKYMCDDRLYNFCFNVFGELMNPGYHKKIVTDSMAREKELDARRMLRDELLQELSLNA